MAEVQLAPRQHKQPSRKGKKAWRKNVDLDQVQSGLEQVREEIIQGGVLAEKAPSELFTLDTTGSDTLKEDYRKKNKLLKVDEIIAARNSAIPALESRKRKNPEPIVVEAANKRTKGSDPYVSRKELQRLKNIAYSGDSTPKDIIVPEHPTHDPWAPQAVVERDPNFSFLEEKQPITEPRTLRHAPVSLAASGKATASVKKPDAGKSYNPRFEDWEVLMKREGEKEVEAERRRLKKEADEEERMARALAEAERVEKREADGESEYESAWESEWEGIASEREDGSAPGTTDEVTASKKRNREKTKAERNKIRRRKDEERKSVHDAKMRKRDEQARRIKEIANEFRKKDKLTREQSLAAIEAITSSEESGDEEVLRRRKFGKTP